MLIYARSSIVMNCYKIKEVKEKVENYRNKVKDVTKRSLNDVRSCIRKVEVYTRKIRFLLLFKIIYNMKVWPSLIIHRD